VDLELQPARGRYIRDERHAARFMEALDTLSGAWPEEFLPLRAKYLSMTTNPDVVARFLFQERFRARSAARALLEHARWREDFGLDGVVQEEFPEFQRPDRKPELSLVGRDQDGRPLILWVLRRHDRSISAPRLIRFLIHLLLKGLETSVTDGRVRIFIDCAGFHLKDFDMSFVRTAVPILGGNFPETQFRTHLVHVHPAVRAMFNLAQFVLDPQTTAKVRLHTHLLDVLADVVAPDDREFVHEAFSDSASEPGTPGEMQTAVPPEASLLPKDGVPAAMGPVAIAGTRGIYGAMVRGAPRDTVHDASKQRPWGWNSFTITVGTRLDWDTIVEVALIVLVVALAYYFM